MFAWYLVQLTGLIIWAAMSNNYAYFTYEKTLPAQKEGKYHISNFITCFNNRYRAHYF